MLIDDPNTVMTRFGERARPCRCRDSIDGRFANRPLTRSAEKSAPAAMLRLARFEDACPSAVAISPLAIVHQYARREA